MSGDDMGKLGRLVGVFMDGKMLDGLGRMIGCLFFVGLASFIAAIVFLVLWLRSGGGGG